ncbi:ABC transporter permease [Paenibacillus hemerocallicola]|uniref:ABC transporter permease n=1 Tax=Paenibacillus hemerocallicola TaxID=1172614 RepID=A0A5C4TBN8_9BACL|nr:ABC transporter permease [Paenibacillus hemerocallicola]TNJ65897.1 ABC transporter permease [Paenibacillus hemerocallicola]
MNKLSTVIKFTFMNRVRAKAFVVTTLIFAIILTAMINLPAIISRFSSSDGPAKLGIVGKETEVTRALKSFYDNQKEPELQIVLLGDAGSKEANAKLGKEKLEAKEVKGYLEFTDDAAAGFPKATYNAKSSMDFSMESKLKSTLQAIKAELVVKDMGLTADQRAKLNSPVSIQTVQIQEGTSGKTESQMVLAYVLVYVLLFLLYMTVIGYGNMVATEITAEKSSRVMEVLISSVSPLKQMFGKIIGICLLGLVQIVVFVVVGAANLLVPQNLDKIKSFNIDLGDVQLSLLGYFVIFYLLGYFIYATIFAAVGSLVSRTEEVGQAIMPVTFLIIAGFMIAMFGLQNPNAPFVVAMSFVPFFSPLIMFLRIGMSDPALWEIWLSIGITAVTMFALGWLAAKIYRVGVLMYGKRPSFAELRKAMKAFKV